MSSKTLLKIVFLDRDGTMIYEPPGTKQVDELSDLRILPGVMPGLQRLLKRGYRLVMVSNQDGLGTRQFPKKKFQIPPELELEEVTELALVEPELVVVPATVPVLVAVVAVTVVVE